jgi:DnaK suppressor protein
MNTSELHAFEMQLQRQRRDLLTQIEQQRGGALTRAQAAADHFEHTQDSPAQIATQRETELALSEHELEELAHIDAALARLHAGRYGVCLDCESPIALARLQAHPEASRCIHCQEQAEHH